MEKGIDLGQEFSEEEKKFVVFIVRLLFRRIEEGMVELDKGGMSETIKDLKAVVFDEKGDPIFETITAPVRSLGKAVLMLEHEKLTREAIEREKNSPVHNFLEKPVEISDTILQKYSNENRLTELAFELYKESGRLLSVCAFLYSGDKEGEMILKRDQAICAGLLVRIIKFMTAVIQLSAETDRREVIMALSRCILETVINLRFLIKKNEKRFYDQYVKFSLAPERELYDFILSETNKRSGKELPIETRMLSSIRRTCELSGMRIQDVESKFREWGGGLRERLGALDQKDLYASFQRIPSHAIHGTWVDLILHHLEAKEGGFLPKATWGNIDDRYFGPIALYTIEGARDYVKSYFGDQPDLKPLYTRMDDLQQRILKVGDAHEDWLEKD